MEIRTVGSFFNNHRGQKNERFKCRDVRDS